MKPILTKSTNGWLFAPEGQPDVLDLPVTRTPGHVSSCWKMSFLEWLKVLFTGKIWFHCRGETHPPMKLSKGL